MLNKTAAIYSELYGQTDKRVCKVKHKIASLFLTDDKLPEALKNFRQVEEMERLIYGDSSAEVARTLKIIGTLFIVTDEISEARDYLMEAHQIFEQRGLIKSLKEVKTKLKDIHQSIKAAA